MACTNIDTQKLISLKICSGHSGKKQLCLDLAKVIHFNAVHFFNLLLLLRLLFCSHKKVFNATSTFKTKQKSPFQCLILPRFPSSLPSATSTWFSAWSQITLYNEWTLTATFFKTTFSFLPHLNVRELLTKDHPRFQTMILFFGSLRWSSKHGSAATSFTSSVIQNQTSFLSPGQSREQSHHTATVQLPMSRAC